MGSIATAARGTLVLSALAGLRDNEVFTPFLEQLGDLQRAQLLAASALSWIPIEQLLELCLAVDRLKLTDGQIAQIGGFAARSIAATILSTLLRSAGATPWTVLASVDRVWDRFYAGGAVTVVRVGPKDVWIELRGLPHAVSPYCRASTQAFFQALAANLVRSTYARPARAREPMPTSFAFTLSWV